MLEARQIMHTAYDEVGKELMKAYEMRINLKVDHDQWKRLTSDEKERTEQHIYHKKGNLRMAQELYDGLKKRKNKYTKRSRF